MGNHTFFRSTACSRIDSIGRSGFASTRVCERTPLPHFDRPNLIFVKDADGRFVLVNKAIADLYGTTPEALVGRRAREGFPDPTEFSEYLRVEKKVLQTG